MDILTIFNTKLKSQLDDTNFAKVTEEMKTLYLKEAEQKILNYCNISTIPKGLFFVWVDISIDILKRDSPYLFIRTDREITENDINSIKVGDTTLSLNSNTNDKNKAKSGNSGAEHIDEVLLSYVRQLQTYRKFPLERDKYFGY